jgi:hypothetical protein
LQAIMRRPLIAALAALLLAPAAAGAAEPATGHVSADKPVQRWSGEVNSTFVHFVPGMQRGQCPPVFCDRFELDVRETGTLTLQVNSPGSAQFVDMVVTRPGGTVEVFDGDDQSTMNKETFEDAEVGIWKVAIWNNSVPVVFDGFYSGRADLKVPETEE